MNFKTLKRETCAGIVLYNPNLQKLKNNVDVLLNQVNEIILIDNKSDNIKEIEKFVSGYKNCITILENHENTGIAAALNQIMNYAAENNYSWYMSMDQDSCCCSNIIEEYAKALPDDSTVATLCPYVLNNGKETIDEYKRKGLASTELIEQPIDCITSGCLNRVNAAKSVNGYDERLFIDCVDVDYNIRLLSAGFKILKVNSAYMIQFMGDGKPVKFIQFLYKVTRKNVFKRLRYTPVYNDFRLYYIARNSWYIRNKYGKLAGRRMSKVWMIFQYIYYFITYPASCNRIKMINTIRRGIRDSTDMEY